MNHNIDFNKNSDAKKPHKFFEKYLDNDLDKLYVYLENLQDAIVNANFLNLPQEIFQHHNKMQSGAATQTGDFYNIFTFINPAIVKLYDALSEVIKEACDYYEIDRQKQQYMIRGWFNFDYPGKEGINEVSPIANSTFFHDHSGGFGAPAFHGYYCVEAEPSITYYKIGGINGELFENHNKNNRLIVSETGHPHGRDDWYGEKPRVTIAYDISPLNTLGDATYLNRIPWIPLR